MLLTTRDAKIFKGSEQVQAFMAVQCCMTPPATVGNSRWPLFSESWVDYTLPYGANFFHARLGPFYGDAEHESDWADIGGPYAGGPGSDWNPAFWAKVQELVAYAAQKGAWVEVNPIDTWYCKHAQWGDQPMPWPPGDIEACGKYGSPEQEKYIRKVVSELGKFGNVIWLLDNEGDQISNWQESWWTWQRDIIRDEEQKSGFGLRHLTGANPSVGGVGDYVYTHSKQTLTAPEWGKWTINNERNPSGTPEREAANFDTARRQGLAWAFWRAGMSEEEMVETLQRFKDIIAGTPIGCFPPDMADDSAWEGVEPKPSCERCDVVNLAKDQMGNPCGQNPVESGERFAAVVRGMGYCAGFYADQVSIQRPDGLWEEHHVIAWTDGCYTQTGNGFKNVWRYKGEAPPPQTGCTAPVTPTVDKFNLKPHNRWYDSTPLFYGKEYCTAIGFPDRLHCPARSECPGYKCEERIACEQVGIMGPAPKFHCEVGEPEVNPDNAFQARCGAGTWIEVCAADGKTACARVNL